MKTAKTLKCNRCKQEYIESYATDPIDKGLDWLLDIQQYDHESNRCKPCLSGAFYISAVIPHKIGSLAYEIGDDIHIDSADNVSRSKPATHKVIEAERTGLRSTTTIQRIRVVLSCYSKR